MPVPRTRTALAAAAGIAAAVVLFGYRSPQDSPLPAVETNTVSTPDRFDGWPPFVITWKVTRAIGLERAAGSPLSAAFTRDPCIALDSPQCYVRLAWENLTRWSLTASSDPVFDRSDPTAFTVGPLHYGVSGGVMVGELATDRVPQLHLCNRLLAARQRAGSVTAEPLASGGSSSRGLRLEGPGGEAASCLGPAGIPVDFRDGGLTWEGIGLQERLPTDGEIGTQLVAARAPDLGRRSCSEASGVAFSASPGGVWLLDLVVGAGYEAAPAGSVVVFTVPSPSGRRTAAAWVTEAGQSPVPNGARRRLVGDGVVVDEILEPTLVQSTLAGGVRIWIMFDLPADLPRTRLEREAFVLGRVTHRVAAHARDGPYGGSPPVGRGVIPAGSLSVVAAGPIGVRPLRVPDRDAWLPAGVLTNGLPVWEAADGRSILVLAGGSFEVGMSPKDPIADEVAAHFDMLAACPAAGLPAQPR